MKKDKQQGETMRHTGKRAKKRTKKYRKTFVIEKLAGEKDGKMFWEKVDSGFPSKGAAEKFLRESNLTEYAYRFVTVEWMGYLQQVGICNRKLLDAGIKKETFWGERQHPLA